MAKKQALGKGLAALLKDTDVRVNSAKEKNADKVVGQIAEIQIANIEVNPFQPRTHFDKEALDELAASIKELGIIQPITVRKQKDGKFQLISGERRFRASQKAGLKSVPAYIRIADDQAMLEMALVENIQRQELDAIEVALSYERLIVDCDLTQEQLSERVGKKRSTVTNYLRLLKLPPLIQAGIRDRMISNGHARALINVDDEEMQLFLYKDTVANDYSVRQVESMVKHWREGKNKSSGTATKTKKNQLPAEFESLKIQLAKHFDTKVDINRQQNGKGKILISFSSNDDLNRIIEIFNE
ncbi:MAG: ParB/RepB/Spo0J family partition protein [Schleiferiaceae bacterium]|jgi:ParB family chromosome partitioning protein|nr:ParB/RepB/Spo0J family partition protein [Schleiferiaceae bacterium]